MNKSLKQLGSYKNKISLNLIQSEDIKKILLGNKYLETADDEEIEDELITRIKSQEYIDGVVTESKAYIFYDVTMPRVGSTIKDCRLVVYIMCHRHELDMLKSYDYKSEKLIGNKVDILSVVVDDVLESDVKNLGIGELDIKDVVIYNSKDFYGRVLVYDIPDFR